MRSRREDFDDLVLDAADRMRERIGSRADHLDFAVEEVPPRDPAPWEEQLASLGRFVPRPGRTAGGIVVVHRRPVEARARDLDEVEEIVREVVVEQVAAYLGVPPDELTD